MRRRILIVAVLASVFGLLMSSAALSSSKPVFETYTLPDSTEFRTWPGNEANLMIEEGQPFYFIGGFEEVPAGYNPQDFQVQMFMDGVQIEPTHVGCSVEEAPKAGDCRGTTHVFDFPEGMEPDFYELFFAYVAPCGVWPDFVWINWSITSCLDDKQLITHPEANGRKTLTVTPIP